MHPNPVFRTRPASANLAFARTRGFGTLAINGDHGPLASHVPFVLDEAGDEVRLHLVRSNPIARMLDQPAPCLLAVSGPDGYISPDWYGAANQVPTWNYVAVHLRGRLERLPDARLPGILEELSEVFETRLAPKPVWTMEKVEPEMRDRMMRAIVPARMIVETVDGTWKLGQNKDDAARLGAAEAVETGLGQELAALSALMRAVPRDPPEAMDTVPDRP